MASRAGLITSSLELPDGAGWIGLALVRRACLQEPELRAAEAPGLCLRISVPPAFQPPPSGSGGRVVVLIQQPADHGPGGQAVVLVVAEDPLQLAAQGPARGAPSPAGGFPPLPPPEQAAGAVHPLLAPGEAQPARHRLQPVAVHRQQPVAPQPLVHVHQPGPQPLPFRRAGTLAFGQAQQGDRLGFAVVEHGPVGIARQQGAAAAARDAPRRAPGGPAAAGSCPGSRRAPERRASDRRRRARAAPGRGGSRRGHRGRIRCRRGARPGHRPVRAGPVRDPLRSAAAAPAAAPGPGPPASRPPRGAARRARPGPRPAGPDRPPPAGPGW